MKTPALALASDAAGTWVSQDGGLKVQLVDCGNRICGRVVWLGEPLDRTASRRPTCKIPILPSARVR